MTEFEFELIFRLPDGAKSGADYLDRLYEAGCDDALIGTGRTGMIVFSFMRVCGSAQDAVESAIADIKKAIPEATLVEAYPDYVGVSDLSGILGHSRQNTRKLLLGSSAPAPLHVGNPSIWHLSEILEWMKGAGLDRRYQISPSINDIALATRKVNFARELASIRGEVSS